MLKNIHQTVQWGEFQSKSFNRTVPNLAAPGAGQLPELVIRQRLPHNKCWLYMPRGPLVDLSADPLAVTAALANTFRQVANLAKKQNAVFFRFDADITDHAFSSAGGLKPAPQAISTAQQLFQQAAAQAGFKLLPAHAHYQPESTLILDLTLSQEQLLAQMKPKGRYNIKVAQKHGVTIERYDAASCPTDTLKKHIETYYNLLSQTTARDGFSGHPQKYYLDMLQTLTPGITAIPGISAKSGSHASPQTPPPAAYLYLAYYNDPSRQPSHNEPIAGIIVTHYAATAIYYFGASGNQHRNVMAPYLLQWQAICDAKAAGLKYYDFLGIAPLLHNKPASSQNAVATIAPSATSRPSSQNAPSNLASETSSPSETFDPHHPWAKVTDFKLKFGGHRVNYIPAYEIVFQPFWYWLIRLTKKVKGLLR